MNRREFTRAQKSAIVHRAMNKRGQVVCEGCGLVLASKKFEIDHVVAEALVIDKSKSLTIEEGQLLGMDCCHRGPDGKTADDVGRIAKAVRCESRHLGIKPKSRGFRKPPGTKWNWKRNRLERMAT